MQHAAQSLLVEEVEALLVVDERDALPLDPLALVLDLLALEDVPVELRVGVGGQVGGQVGGRAL